MKIKKVKQAIGIVGNVVDSLDATGENDVPNVKAVNSIIESGSNANGHYIKFSDGTLIQRGTFTSQPNVEKGTINLPTAFIDNSYQVNTSTCYQRSRVAMISWSLKTKWNFEVFPSFYDWDTKVWSSVLPYEQDWDWIAIGKWK